MTSQSDVFYTTELELAKAKRQFATLEKRMEEERLLFSKDYRHLNTQLLAEREKKEELQSRVFEIESELHKERIARYSGEEEFNGRRRILEEEIKRYKVRTDEKIGALENEVKETKEVWALRLNEERRLWQAKNAEKTESMQNSIDQTRDYYKNQLESLHGELADLLTTHRQTKEELEMTQAALRDEKRKKKLLKLELDESKEKYRRCLNLASDLVALRKSRSYGTTLTDYSTTRPWSASTRSITGISSSSSNPQEDGQDVGLVKKQLGLTQVLLDEELKKNRELREEVARSRIRGA